MSELSENKLESEQKGIGAFKQWRKKYRKVLGLDSEFSEEYYKGAMFACFVARDSPDEFDEFEKEIERECEKWRIYRTLLKQLRTSNERKR